MTKVWVTNRALTDGIVAVEGERCELDKTGFYVRGQLPGDDCVYRFPHWHESRQEAVNQARLMRAKRMASLNVQLERLRAMTFEAEE